LGTPAISSGNATFSSTVRHGKRRFLLEHHADRGVRSRHRAALDGDAPAVIAGQAADDVEQRRLAAARRPDDRHELAGRHRKRHVVDGDEGAVASRETFGDVADVEQASTVAQEGGP
jgi:hypothetical protein